jgi:DNA mismatch endonuclease (patch repair protein)
MTDRWTPELRSRIMRAVPTKNTTPELAVRSILFRMGFRYRLHKKNLPGTPDIVFPGRRKAIFVNGCFWHGHSACQKGRLPKSRPEYWLSKIERNARNDSLNIEKLAQLGWRTLTLWQCEIKNDAQLRNKLLDFLTE